MTKHSTVVGGSTAALRRICNASIEQSQGVPVEGWNIYAATGTALHSITETAIRENMDREELSRQFKGIEMESVRITEDMLRDKVWPALGFFDDTVPIGAYCDQERKIHFEGLMEGAFGTADVIFDDEKSGRCGIIDWKFGDNHLVNAEENDQMRFYLAAAIHCSYLPIVERYEAWIFQPSAKLSPDRYASVGYYTYEDLQFFVQDLKNAVDGERVYVTGEHCRWCKGKVDCRAYHTMLSGDVTTDLAGLGANELARRLNELPAIEAYVKELRTAALRNAQAGVQIPGWGLETSYGNRAWKDEDAAWASLGRMGVPLADRTVKKCISPAQAEKRLKAIQAPDKKVARFFKTHIERNENGEKLVRRDTPDEGTFTRLGNMLKAIA